MGKTLLVTRDRESNFFTFDKVMIEELLLNVLRSQSAEDKFLVVNSNFDTSALLRLDILAKRGLGYINSSFNKIPQL
jgi:hypothetical protein